jgi:hypothetical protein
MQIISYIINNHKNFRYAIWNPGLDIFNNNILFEICVEQLKNDLLGENIIYHTVKRDSVISMYEKCDGKYSISYYKYIDIIGFEPDEFHVRVRTGDKPNLDKFFNINEFRYKLLDHCELKSKKLTGYDRTNSQTIRSSDNPVKYLINKMGDIYDNLVKIEVNEVGKPRLMVANKTNIIIICSINSTEISHYLCELSDGNIYFVDIFHAERKPNQSNDVGFPITGLKHQRVNRESSVFVFSKLSTALDFVNSNLDKNYLIVIDRFSQVYNNAIWQRLAITNNYNMLYIGKYTDLKYFYNNNNNLYGDNKVVTSMINNNLFPQKKEFVKCITKVDNEVIEELIESIQKEMRDIKLLFPGAVKNHKDLLYRILKCVTPSDEDIDEIIEMCHKLNIENGDKLRNELLVDNGKLKEIYRLSSSYKSIRILDDHSNIDLNRIHNNQNIAIINKNDLHDNKYQDCIIVLYFITPWFLMNTLFPLLLYGKIKVEQIRFITLNHEIRVIMHLYNKFLKRIEPFVDNAKEYLNMEVSSYVKSDIESDDVIDMISSDYDYNYNDITRHYFQINRDGDDDKLVSVNSLGLSDRSDNYIVFVTSRYKPYMLENDDIVKVDIGMIGYGDTLVFFGGQGERGVLETYREFFFKGDDRHINNVIKWKSYLKQYLNITPHKIDKQRMRIFLREINNRGLNRSKIDVLRWIDDETIGTMKPKDDFRIIAKVIGKKEFINEADELAESCIYLQSKCKRIGKILKKIALRDIVGIENAIKKENIDSQIQGQLDRIAEKIKFLDVHYIDMSENKFVNRSLANTLIETNNAKANPTLFE